jgi:MFS transporter, DHA1 family, multidrug resistance protein
MTSLTRIGPTARGLVILYTSTLFSAGWAMIIPSIPVLATQFGVSAGTAAQVITAFAFGKFVGMPIGGMVLDRLGTRGALLGGPVAASVAALLAAGTPWFGAMLGLLVVMGAGDSLWTLGREVAGIDLARKDQRGRVLSGFHGIHSIGLALGPLIGGVLTEAVSFKAAFIAYAACAAVSVPLGLIVHTARPSKSPRLVSQAVKGRGLAPLLRRLRGLSDLFKQIQPHLRATYAVIVLATMTSFMHRSTMQSMLPLYAGSYLGFTPTEVGLLFSISGAFVFAMILPAGFVIDKVGRKWATVPSTGIPALAFLLIPFSNTFFQLAVLVSLVGVANGLSLGSLATSTYDVVPPSARGRLQAARRTVAEIGGTSAPLFGGLLADALNPGVPFLVYAPLLVLSAVLLALVGRETLVR